MSIKLLERVGLSEEQAKVYSCLIANGAMQARKVSLECGLNRSLVYKILKQLIELDLASESSSPGSVNTFAASNPTKLQAIIKNKEDELRLADQALNEAINTLSTQFNITHGKPSVRFYEGLDGVKMLNKDILMTKSDVKLIRSPFDNNTEELDSKARKFLEDRAILGIKTKLIVPIKNNPSSISPEWDKMNLIERRRVPREELLNAAQIIIYSNKVAFTSFGSSMITTIIEDSSITETCTMLFNALWRRYEIMI
jgi:sugar-specific transcriptional regulator TrmB